MLHPSYADLIKVVNSEAVEGEDIVSSRYSIVMATSKRARQIIAGDDALVESKGKKPLSVAVEELSQGKIKILGDEETEETAESAKDEYNILDETDEEAEAEENEETEEVGASAE